MSKDILYYPTIEFKKEDLYWLWSAALLWDKVYRIVPDEYRVNDCENVKELCSTGEIGIPLSPKRYSTEASKKFMSNIESRKWNAAALTYDSEEIKTYDNYNYLHTQKVDVALRNLMLLNKNISQHHEWLVVPCEMANQYMIYLATEMAEKNDLALHTHDNNVWTASTFFLFDDSIQEGVYPGEGWQEESKTVIAPMYINKILPINLLDITPSQILRFRKERKDERKRFNEALDAFSDKISKVNDPSILKQLWHDERKEVESALCEYKKSMDIIKVCGWVGGISSMLTIATDALGYTDFSKNAIQYMGSAGIGLGLLTGLARERSEIKPPPYSYLSYLSELGKSNFSEYNYNLYRKMEEFIND